MNVRTEPKVEPEKATRFVFKSKFREDKVTIDKPHVTLNPDGTKTVEGHRMAEFSRNTWATDDELDAEKLRTAIRNREKRGSTLNIIETTDINAPGKKAAKAKGE